VPLQTASRADLAAALRSASEARCAEPRSRVILEARVIEMVAAHIGMEAIDLVTYLRNPG
jgi:hypothetical protein